jgi:hypothetical protein
MSFENEPTGDSARREPKPFNPENLHECWNGCPNGLVYPVTWDVDGDYNWIVERRCPECNDLDMPRKITQGQCDIYDEEMKRGTESVVRGLRKLMRDNMKEDVDRFTDALHSGHILPEDFN